MLRFSQSLTKEMSISDLRVAIFNHIVSKQSNEKLIIRIEDTDKDKNIEGKDKEILELLNLFSIDYEGVFHQSDNLKYHQKLTMQLMGQKNAFACFCSDVKIEELKQEAKKKNKPYEYDGFCQTLSDETVLNVNSPFIVRIKKPDENIVFKDLLKGELSFKPSSVDSFPILRQDKTPTHNYANAVDDMLFDISSVITSEDNINDAAKQIHIRKLLNYDKEIEFAHIPNINIDSKYSSVKQLIDDGFLPSAIANYLVLLGNETPKEIFTLEEAIEWFKIKDISKEAAKFNIEKLKEINKKHLLNIDNMRFSKILGFADDDIGKLAKLFLNENSTIKEIKEKIDLIFAPKSTCEGFEEEFVELKLALNDAPFIESFSEFKEFLSKKTQLNDSKLLKPLTYILTGQTKLQGIELEEVYPLIKNYLGEITK
ncbi:glutamate--tRNA ligase [Arcobacter sp. CECT 8983]|uniref:glutamate--tRNA ligase n=1 Tax=Arcobacter sp. CECT 8983 TaxID=2044508 RepID=UPI00100AF3D7|nr:glutamate--tRNA ligase [Arcobacter sp. CECT 8983]RXJ89269.1 glutamate--tRNA ligase [Arcobacter sp. CECT 8983]